MVEKEIGYSAFSFDCQYASVKSKSGEQSKLTLFFLTQSQRSKKKKKTHKTKVSPRLRSNRSITEMYSPSDRVSHLTVPPIGWSPLCPVAPTLWHPEGQIRNTESGEEVLRTWTWSSIVVENLPWVVHLFGGAPHSGHERKSDKASALKQLLLRAER